MRITVLALGTRGDLQPHVALGTALQGVSYDVRIATASAFRDLVTGYGLAFSLAGCAWPGGDSFISFRCWS